MNRTYAALFCLILSCQPSYGSETEGKAKLIESLHANASCNQSEVAKALSEIEIDKEVVAELYKVACHEPLDALPKEKKPSKETIFAAARLLTEYLPGAISEAERFTKDGQVLVSRAEHNILGNLEYATGSGQAISEAACKQKDELACKALPQYAQFVKRLEALRPVQEKLFFKDDAKAALIEACKIKHDMADDEKAIQEQKDVAKVSGVANTKILYESGRVVADGQRRIASLNDRYKKGTGRPLDLTKCPKN